MSKSAQITSKKFQQEYLKFQNELKSYLTRILGNIEDAEDLAQDAYIKALKNLSNFRGDSSLKTWVFTIATNLARDHFRGKQRWTVDAQENARQHSQEEKFLIDRLVKISEDSPAGVMEIREHIDFCFSCMAKTLSIEQQVALILKDIYSFRITEIVQIMQLSEGKLKHALADGRKILMEVFENRCALVHKNGACHQCTELNGIINPKQNAREELMKIRMIREANACKSPMELYRLRTELVRSIDPLHSNGSDLYSYFLSLMPAYSGLEEVPKE